MIGIEVLPPRDSVTIAPTPACVICSTARGSQIAKAQTSDSPALRMPSSTVVVSMVPPEAQLS